MRKYIYLAMLTAISLIISLFEAAMPLPFIAPGVKLGLSNIVILTTLVVFGFKEGLTVGVLKSFLLMLVSGSVTSLAYSLAGAVGSIIAMNIAYKYFSKSLSLIGISILGAAVHNLCQLSVAVLVTKSLALYAYLPILLIIGLFTGFFVGLACIFITNQLKKLNLGG